VIDKNRVAVLVEPKHVELHEETLKEPAAGSIRVRVRAALTDGTDLKTYRRGHPQMQMPTRFGHEFSGDVAAIGDGVSTFSIGDAVMCVHTAPCGRCFWCTHEQEEMCERVMPTMLLGAYADYIDVPKPIVDRNCFAKPQNLSYVEAAFLEPLSCVVHSLSTLPAVDDVAIVGDGAFGILHALVLRERGARPVVIGRRAERLEVVRGYNLDGIDARTTNVIHAVRERTSGRGADAGIECTGTREAWEQTSDFVRRGGTVSLFGGLPSGTPVTFSSNRLHYDEIRVISPFHFAPRDVRSAYELLSQQNFDVMPLVTHTYRLAEIDDAFARLDVGEGMKARIEP
jgi:L-iditol 2-dehydrogenase